MSSGNTAIPVSPVDFITMLQDLTNKAALVPDLQFENSRLERERNEAQDHNQKLELSIRGYRDQIDALNAKVRSLAVERDDASFRELETADKLEKLLSALGSFRADLDTATRLASPPKADPAPVTGQSEPYPTTVAETASASAPANTTSGAYSGEQTKPTEGERAADPTPVQSTDGPSPSAGTQAVASSDATPTSNKPYFGQPWWKKPNDMSYAEWTDKGGEA